MTWDRWTKTSTKFQGEGRTMRKRLIPKSDRVTLYASARWLGKFQTWFRATSPSEHHLKESEDSLPMVLMSFEVGHKVYRWRLGHDDGFCARKTKQIWFVDARGSFESRSETINNATWVFDFESGHLDDETRRSQLGLRNWRTRNWLRRVFEIVETWRLNVERAFGLHGSICPAISASSGSPPSDSVQT